MFLERVFLSIVIPAYNEEKRIGATLEKVTAFLKCQPFRSEVLVIDDGSSDNTSKMVRPSSDNRALFVDLVQLPHRGKGHAVKVGMLEAHGDFRFMADADLSMPIEEVLKFLPPTLKDSDVAIGSREAPGARRYDEPPYRHFMGRGFNKLVGLMAVGGISDTQCGFKCFTAEAANRLFKQQRLDGFGFDVEILFLASKSKLRLVEVPINWYYQKESKVRPVRDTLRMFRDVLSVRLANLRGHYR